jgi:hypothetical protein
MSTIVLDLEFISRNARILQRKSAIVKFVVPHAVIEALQQRRQVESVAAVHIDVIFMAEQHGYLRIASPISETPPNIPLNLIPLQAQVLATALDERKRGADGALYVASADPALAKVARELGIVHLDARSVSSMLVKDAIDVEEIVNRLDAYSRYESRSIAVSAGAGALSALIVTIAVLNFGQIVAKIDVWGVVLAALTAGFSLYYARLRWRLAYAAAEILVGCLTALHPLLVTSSYAQMSPMSWLPVLGGVYVIVRGLENLGKALETTSYAGTWRRTFPS